MFIEVMPAFQDRLLWLPKPRVTPWRYVAAKLALGKSLLDVEIKLTSHQGFFEPALDYVVVKMPRWI